jgi:hypothetical protein
VSGAEFGGDGWVGVGLEVLDVKHGDAGGVVFEVFDGVSTTDDDPAAIHFEGDLGGIGDAEELVVGDDAVDGVKFGCVVVIAETDAGGVDFFAEYVELVGVPAPVVEGECVTAVGISWSGAGADEVADTDSFIEGEKVVEVFVEIGEGVVGADEFEVGVGHGLFDFGGSVVEVAGGFDFAVAESAELFECAGVVFGELGADGVELEGERETKGFGCGEEIAAVGCGEESGGGTGLEEVSSGLRWMHGGLSFVGRCLIFPGSNDRWMRRFCRMKRN